MIRVFIGFDPRETVGFHVLSHSIHAHASEPVAIAALARRSLGSLLTRARDPLQSTDFSFSRFLTPYLCGFRGWALYLDCDMLFLDDVARLWALRDDRYAVLVVKHDYVPRDAVKFLGAAQTAYARKNWSSVMLLNNTRCRALTPAYVNSAGGLDLHQFRWLDDDEIGELPPRWNHLVGEYPYRPDAGNVHFTRGGPYFDGYGDCDYAAQWFAARNAAFAAEPRRPSS